MLLGNSDSKERTAGELVADNKIFQHAARKLHYIQGGKLW